MSIYYFCGEMKLIAIILVLSMGFLGLNRFTLVPDQTGPSRVLSCTMDCCDDEGACCCNDHSKKNDQATDDGPEKEMQCHGGCDCSFSIQVLATGIHLRSHLEPAHQAFYFGSLRDHYHFEYLAPRFQPPRMA